MASSYKDGNDPSGFIRGG